MEILGHNLLIERQHEFVHRPPLFDKRNIYQEKQQNSICSLELK